jgi:hypothetical protein|tara:strand:+ start:242 stop:472 length:231 start_codon:yes stop_codon:yes gene_type:complete
MTQFTSEVEKQAALIELEKWRRQVKYIYSDTWEGTRTTMYNDERKVIEDIKSDAILEITASPHRRRTLIDIMLKQK